MNSLEAAQAQNGLWHELWLVAVDEAYTAKDAQRRIDELQGLPERDVVAVYFSYHPEMKKWAEDHIRNKTCDVAITELRKVLRDTRSSRNAHGPAPETPIANQEEPADADTIAPSPQLPTMRRGPKPRKMEKIVQDMLLHLKSGMITKDELLNEKQESLADTYKASRETCCKARDIVMLELSRNKLRQTPTIDK